MVQRHYPDGGNLPYRVIYSGNGRIRSREVRFSRPDTALREIEKLTRRGHVVDYSEWDYVGKRYVTKDRYS